jgi:hypothetical protein
VVVKSAIVFYSNLFDTLGWQFLLELWSVAVCGWVVYDVTYIYR